MAVAVGGVLGGGVNGVLVGKLGLSFLVVTLGTLILFRGIVNIWSDTQTTYISSPFLDSLAFDELLGIADAGVDHGRDVPRGLRPALGRTSAATSTPSAATPRRPASRASA